MNRTGALMVSTSLMSLLAACSGPTSTSSGPCDDVLDQPVTTVANAEIQQVPEGDANVVLDVTSSRQDPVRLTVHFDGRLALDVRLPATSANCSHPPVFTFAYEMPDREVTIRATTDDKDRSKASLGLEAHTVWAVMQLQEGFPLEIESWESEPQWG